MAKFILIKDGNALSCKSTSDTIIMTENELVGARIYSSRGAAINNLNNTAQKQARKHLKYEKNKYYDFEVYRRFTKLVDSLSKGFEVVCIDKEDKI